MVTLALQCVLYVVALGFGVAALRVASSQHPEAPPVHGYAWSVTGWGYVLVGLSGMVQSAFAVAAFRAGAESEVYRDFILWSPVTNHARSGLVLMIGLLLLAAALRVQPPAYGRAALMLGGIVAGASLGVLEGALEPSRHFAMVAVVEVLVLLVLVAALLASLAAGAMDRHLWIALAVYALLESVSALWLAGLAWDAVPGAWSPSPKVLAGLRLVLLCVMLAVTLRRLHLARAGIAVSTLLDAPARPGVGIRA